MITDKELNIANTSYTKKDFYQIYPEILELVTKITERWHPETSNESDPGVVLLKLLAFIADKNNYNIDKNILECFMPSATQEESMRKLCDMMGYEMKYYQSAKTDISFMWLGSSDVSSDFKFTLPKYTTTVQSKEGDVTYTLIGSDVQFGEDQLNKTITCEAIEGQMFKMTVGESDIIMLDNIDDNNRLYLPELSIAENGIFVEFEDQNKSDRIWEKTDNLNTILPGSYRWKFGFDSLRQLPYIQFPDDIAQLIEDGLNVWYTRTTGANGNVSQNVLTKLTSNKEVSSGNEELTLITDSDDGTVNLIISNKSSTINGQDAETIDQAYNGFKKTVGTFDTLVTCRDYANAIYKMVTSDIDSSPLVSNCQVGDIRTDVFKSSRVRSFNVYGEVAFDVPERDAGNQNLINNFDLTLYPLKKISNVYNSKTYNQSFDSDYDSTYDITQRLDDQKTMSHQFKLPSLDDLYLIKNYYKLNAKITTTYKVDIAEAKDILENVYEALYKNFNSHMIEYGKEIPFDSLLEVIKNSDYRVKNVSLDEPELETRFMYGSGSHNELSPDDSIPAGDHLSAYEKVYLKLLSKNILAGRLPLFSYNTSFDTSFDKVQFIDESESGELVGPVVGHDSNKELQITRLSTLFDLPVSSISGDGYKLKDNEVIQFRCPSLRTSITYPYLVNYFFSPADQNTVIDANQEYQLAAGDKLYINYSESEDGEASSVHNVEYYKDANDGKYYEHDCSTGSFLEFSGIIRFNFSVDKSSGKPAYQYTKKSGFDPSWTEVDAAGGMLSFGAKEQLEIRDFIKIEFNSNSTINKFFWLTNDGYLFDEGETVKTLVDGEYLFFTNDAENELSTLGAGTVITTSLTAAQARSKYRINYNDANKVSVDDVASNGLAAFSDVRWKEITFASGETLVCQEMQFITLTAGDTIKTLVPHSALSSLSNTFVWVDSSSYILSGKNGSLTIIPNTPDFKWEVKSRYDINCSSEASQTLGQYNHLKAYNYNDVELCSLNGSNTDAPSLSSNYALLKEGSNDIDAKVLDLITLNELNNLKLLIFSKENDLSTDIQLHNFDENYTKINISDLGSSKFNILLPDNNSAAVIMIYYNKGDEAGLWVDSDKSSLYYYKDLDEGTSPDTSLSLSNGINILYITKSCKLDFTWGAIESGGTAGSIIIADYNIVPKNNFGINVKLFNMDDTRVDYKVNFLMQMLNKYGSVFDNGSAKNIFYYNYPIKDHDSIDTSVRLDEYFWYDFNNVASRFVMSELDVNSFENIMISKQSRRF